MLEYVQFILLLFLLFYLLIISYDIVFLRTRKNEEKYSQKKMNKLIELIVNYEKATTKKELTKFSEKIVCKLQKLSYLHVLGILLEKNKKIKDLKNRRIIDILSANSYDAIFIRLTSIYSKKDSLDKAYYAYILKYIHPNREEIYSFLCKLVLSSSIYSTENALLALYHIGNCKLISEIYQKMNKKNILYNHRLIGDGLLEFTGNKEELCRELYKNFDKFNEETKIGILTFFRYSKYDIKEELLRRLEMKNNEKEVEIAMIRYFSKVYFKEARDLFVKRLEEEYYHDFEYDVVMIQAIGKTNKFTKKVISVLEQCLHNPNYYVRLNAAKVLNKKIDLRTISEIEEPTVKSMIEYIMD